MYALPIASADQKFYLLPFRLFEIAIGSLAYYFSKEKINITKSKLVVTGIIIAQIVILLFPMKLESHFGLIGIVTLTSILLFFKSSLKENVLTYCISVIGKNSYGIYLSHQIVIAFCKYALFGNITIESYMFMLGIIVIIASITVLVIERIINRLSKKKLVIVSTIMCIIFCMYSGFLYMRAGVIKDIPELDVSTDNISRGMYAEYNDRIFELNRDFNKLDTIKVLVIGSSFGRDMANVLLESNHAEDLDVVYIPISTVSESDMDRVEQADYIFVLADCKVNGNMPKVISDNLRDDAQLWGIGTKQFGVSNGIIYNRRYSDNYYQSTASFIGVKDLYLEEVEAWGDYYYDFISPVRASEDEVYVFTDDYKFISQDCVHLTQAGASYYARITDWDKIFVK